MGERLDRTQEAAGSSPASSTAAGEGIHFWLGAPLARLQLRVVLDTLLPVMPDFSVNGPVTWLSAPGDRGIESLPVAL